jgi:hypothetical protein
VSVRKVGDSVLEILESGPATWPQIKSNIWSDERLKVKIAMFNLVDSGQVIVDRNSTVGETYYLLRRDMM